MALVSSAFFSLLNSNSLLICGWDCFLSIMSLPTEASTTWIEAVPRAAAAKNDKPKHSDPPVAIALETAAIAAPATTALPAPASPAVPASPASAGTVVPAASNPAAAQAASTPATSVEQSSSLVSSKALERTPAPAPTNKSTLESAVAASQIAPSGATATPSSPTPSESLLNASSIAAQGEITITSIPHSRIPTSTIALSSLTQASGESPANSLAVAPASTPSTPHINLASVIGGVVGGLAFVSIFLFLWWRCNRRKVSRSSLLTPLTTQFERTATRSMSEKQAGSNEMARDLSQILAMKDGELRQIVDPRRRSLSTPAIGLRSPVLDFGDTSDPFADPPSTLQQIIPNLSKPPARLVLDPFADPVDLVSSFALYQHTSSDGASVRCSRGQSQSIHIYSAPTTLSRSSISTNPTNRGSCNSFTVRSSQNSYPDVVISALSISSRTTRGRSDPFDLERLRL
jgi:hypothetical protein